jgi:hypothetical protein
VLAVDRGLDEPRLQDLRVLGHPHCGVSWQDSPASRSVSKSSAWRASNRRTSPS